MNTSHDATLVIGASLNSARYSYKAIESLVKSGIQVVAFGLRAGEVAAVPIVTNWNQDWKIDTVTLYLNPDNQEPWKAAILALKPRRVIFNPGTENQAFADRLANSGIEVLEACSLVLLATNQY